MIFTTNSFKTKIMLWTTWFIVSIFFAYQYILRVMPSMIMQDLMQQFDLDEVLFGQISGIYYIGYALMHLPLGILLDRFGTKRIMPVCVMLTVIGMLPILFTSHWLLAISGRLLVGIGSSGAILSAFKVIHHMFGPQKFTRILSFTVMIGLIGAIYGGGPLDYLCTSIGYKYVTALLAIFGVGLALIAFLTIPEFTSQQNSSILYDVKHILSKPKILIVCALAGLMVGPLEGFADLWGKQFLQVIYGFDGNTAATLSSMLFLGTCFGSPLLSYIAAKIDNDSITIFIAGIIMAIGFLILLMGIGNTMLLSVIFAIVGGCCTYQTYAIFKASTYVKAQAIGLTTAVANMIIMLFGYAFHTVIGTIINYCGGSTSSVALKFGISVVPMGLMIGAIGFLVIHFLENRRDKISIAVEITR